VTKEDQVANDAAGHELHLLTPTGGYIFTATPRRTSVFCYIRLAVQQPTLERMDRTYNIQTSQRAVSYHGNTLDLKYPQLSSSYLYTNPGYQQNSRAAVPTVHRHAENSHLEAHECFTLMKRKFNDSTWPKRIKIYKLLSWVTEC
jgi:hypothetical protein